MNAVIYARYSSDRQREESIEGQLRECTDYAMKNNLLPDLVLRIGISMPEELLLGLPAV